MVTAPDDSSPCSTAVVTVPSTPEPSCTSGTDGPTTTGSTTASSSIWRSSPTCATDMDTSPSADERPHGSSRCTGGQVATTTCPECEGAMCRWMACMGDPDPEEELPFRPKHSIIDQSLHAKLGGFTTNGDGFGIGWYGDGAAPAVYKSALPAWSDENLREVAGQIRTPLLFAHVRASSGNPVQRSNCHPFRYGRWLWMHNGSLARFPDVKHDLVLAVDSSLYPAIEGSTDTEMLFFLALTFGLADNPPAAVARAVGFVEDVGRRRGVEYPVHMTVATTDGESIWVFRYSSEKTTSSLYYSADVSQVRRLYPELDVLDRVGPDTRL